MESNIEPTVEQVAPKEFRAYKRLRELENEMDEKIQRKRRDLDVQVRSNPCNVRRTLQVCVYHTFSPPSLAEPEGTWTLRIEGSIQNGRDTSKRFSSFFRKVIVELDDTNSSGSNVIEWTCFRSSEETDGFEITRKGTTSQRRISIKMLRNYSPEHFQVSDALLQIIKPYMQHRKDDTRQNIVLAVWQYVKFHNLLQENDSRVIVCDALMEKVFGKTTIPFKDVLTLVKPHLHPLSPIELQYELNCDENQQQKSPGQANLLDQKTFDIEIDTEEGIDRLRGEFFQKCIQAQETHAEDIRLYDEQCRAILGHINQLNQEREWLAQFCEDPVHFIQDVVKSQQADLDLLTADYRTDLLQENGEYFRQAWVNDAIGTLWNAAT